jgi:tetratricopeptide (TPR) repeat protein
MHSINKPRPRRPYEQKSMSKAGALIFGLGLGALAATLALLIGLMLPNISSRLENLPYYARTYYRKLVPPPQYLPTPAPTAAAVATPAPSEMVEPAEPEPLPTANQRVAGQAVPVALTTVEEDTESLSESPPLADHENFLAPIRDAVQLGGINHQWQTWNNCGPATITMSMSYFGRSETQVDAAKFLKPNKDDKNVSPHELAAYVRTSGLAAIVRQGGSLELLETLLSNDFPVLAETWLIHDGDGLGHYRLLTGYDKNTNQFNTDDSLNGPNFKVDMAQFDQDWRVFNRVYLVVFPPDQADKVFAIIGDDLNDTTLYERLLAEAQAETEAQPDDAIAWFNKGDALTRLSRYDEAVIAFDQARQIGLHWRRLWYQFTPFEAYYVVGRYQDVLDLTEATLNVTGGLEEVYYYHGLALHATGQPGAVEDFQAALAYNPHFAPAANALDMLSN